MTQGIGQNILDQVIATVSPGTAAVATSQSDRVRPPRYVVDSVMEIVTRDTQSGHREKVCLQNLSEGGLRILREMRMQLDEPFVATLPLRDGSTAHALYRVLYWEPVSADSVGIGARFQRMLTPAEVSNLSRTLNHAAADPTGGYEVPITRLAS